MDIPQLKPGGGVDGTLDAGLGIGFDSLQVEVNELGRREARLLKGPVDLLDGSLQKSGGLLGIERRTRRRSLIGEYENDRNDPAP